MVTEFRTRIPDFRHDDRVSGLKMMGLRLGPRRAIGTRMIEYCIRLSEREEAFIYSLRRGGVVVETEEVRAPGVAEPDAECEYYGGSQAMD